MDFHQTVYALILWRSALVSLMGKFHHILTELSARHMAIFSFPDDYLSKFQWIFTGLGAYIDIVEIWFGIPNGQISSNFDGVICPWHIHIFVSGRKLEWMSVDFHQTWYMHWYFGDLVFCPSLFSFSDNYLSKCQWILTKLGVCNDIVEIWSVIASGQISSSFDADIFPRHFHIIFPDDNLSQYQWTFTKLGICIDIVQIWFRTAIGQILSVFDRVICPRQDKGGVLSFHVFFISQIKTSSEFEHRIHHTDDNHWTEVLSFIKETVLTKVTSLLPNLYFPRKVLGMVFMREWACIRKNTVYMYLEVSKYQLMLGNPE